MDIELNEDEIHHIRWALNVAINILADHGKDENSAVDKRKAFDVIAIFDTIDEKLYSYINEEDEEEEAEQLSFMFNE